MTKFFSPVKIISSPLPREETYKHIVASAETVLFPRKFKRINPPGPYFTSTLYQYGSVAHSFLDVLEINRFVELNFFCLVEPLNENSFALSIQNLSYRRNEKYLSRFDPIFENLKIALKEHVTVSHSWEEASRIIGKEYLSSPGTFIKNKGILSTL